MSEGTAAKPGSRREGRERMLGYLYEAEAKGVTAADIVEGLPLAVDGYARQLLEGLGDDVSGIDTLIEDTSHAWRVDRMPAVDRALLRMAVYELVQRPDIPAAAVINEAVELAAEYSTDASSRFINGVLAKVASVHRPDESVSVA